MELEKLFCEIDDFCVILEEAFKSKVITSEKQQRQRKSQQILDFRFGILDWKRD